MGRVPAGVRRRAPDRPQGPNGRPAPLRDHPHFQPGLRDPRGPGLGFTGRSGTFDAAGDQVGGAVVPPGVPQPPRPRRRLPTARTGDHARPAREGAHRRAAPARLPDATVGGRVGRGRDRLPHRAGFQHRARRPAAQAGGRAVPADPDRHCNRRAPVSGRRPPFSSPHATRPGWTSPSSTRTRGSRSPPTEEHELEPAADPGRAGRPPRTTRARASGHGGEAVFLRRARRGRRTRPRLGRAEAGRARRDPRAAFWQSPDRHGA